MFKETEEVNVSKDLINEVLEKRNKIEGKFEVNASEDKFGMVFKCTPDENEYNNIIKKERGENIFKFHILKNGKFAGCVLQVKR